MFLKVKNRVINLRYAELVTVFEDSIIIEMNGRRAIVIGIGSPDDHDIQVTAEEFSAIRGKISSLGA